MGRSWTLSLLTCINWTNVGRDAPVDPPADDDNNDDELVASDSESNYGS